jgi:NAD(P)-dependent dehydrogenase (short-subunit alcohol dehydrogenase family)
VCIRSHNILDFSSRCIAAVTEASRELGRLYAIEFAQPGVSVVLNTFGGRRNRDRAQHRIVGDTGSQFGHAPMVAEKVDDPGCRKQSGPPWEPPTPTVWH